MELNITHAVDDDSDDDDDDDTSLNKILVGCQVVSPFPGA
jgi:hypothetical protein